LRDQRFGFSGICEEPLHKRYRRRPEVTNWRSKMKGPSIEFSSFPSPWRRSTACDFGNKLSSISRHSRMKDYIPNARQVEQNPPLLEVELIVPLQEHAKSCSRDSSTHLYKQDCRASAGGCQRDKQLDNIECLCHKPAVDRNGVAGPLPNCRGYMNLILTPRCSVNTRRLITRPTSPVAV